MDEIRKAAQRAAAEAARGLVSERVVADRAFANTMSNMYANIPSLSDHLRATFASDRTITALAQAIEEWKEKTPENKHLVVMLRTPDGRVMDVALVKPTGWQSFVAEGYIDAMPCMITGHIATLSLFCSYEETKGKSRVGFTIKLEPAIEPQPESVPTPPDSETQTP